MQENTQQYLLIRSQLQQARQSIAEVHTALQLVKLQADGTPPDKVADTMAHIADVLRRAASTVPRELSHVLILPNDVRSLQPEHVSNMLGSVLPPEAAASKRRAEDEARAVLPQLPGATEGDAAVMGKSSGDKATSASSAAAYSPGLTEQELLDDRRGAAADFDGRVDAMLDALSAGRERGREEARRRAVARKMAGGPAGLPPASGGTEHSSHGGHSGQASSSGSVPMES